MFTVGSVPYLNARPLVRRFEDLGADSPVRVLYDVPSRLPELLETGVAQAVLVSSIEALRRPGARVAANVSISSQRDVRSVRLFSRVPPTQIRRVAFDASSMTSNALARLVLKDLHGVEVEGTPQPPVLADMLRDHDAAVLIGNNGMREPGEGLYVLDLGREWLEMTGLPFVWAMWLGDEDLTPELAHELSAAERYGQRNFDDVVEKAVGESGFTYEECEHYLGQIMDYRLTSRHLAGLAEFGRRLVVAGLLPAAHLPTVVTPRGAEVS